MGHVNNAVWVRWVQETATRHWNAVARDEDRARFVWLVTRHEIDYRGNIETREEAVARTWLPHEPKGARFERRVEFRDVAGNTLVSASTVWAMIDRKSGRPARITSEVVEPFRG